MSLIKFLIVFPCVWLGIAGYRSETGQLLLALGFTVATCLRNSSGE